MGERTGEWTVGELARHTGVSVRTLHHYDRIGLVVPSTRSAAGYRHYAAGDLQRLQHVVAYRRLGFSLAEIATLLDDPAADVAAHLRRQLMAVRRQQDALADLATALEDAWRAEMDEQELSTQQQRRLFGASFADELPLEAQQRWGSSDAWHQSADRTRRYGEQEWQRIREELDGVLEQWAQCKRAGLPADSPQARAAAQAHREHVSRWFYDCAPQLHREVAQLWVDDERFARTFEQVEPGLSGYARAAVEANAPA